MATEICIDVAKKKTSVNTVGKITVSKDIRAASYNSNNNPADGQNGRKRVRFLLKK